MEKDGTNALEELQRIEKSYAGRWENLSQADKKTIFELLSPAVQDTLREKWKGEETPEQSRQIWRDLCRVQLQTLCWHGEEDAYSDEKDKLDEQIDTGFDDQRQHQKEALTQGVVNRLPHYTDHTKIDALAHRTGSLAYKAQLSWSSPDEYILGNEETQPGDLIRYSVYDPDKIPPELLDFAATGSWSRQYNHIKKHRLAAWGAEHMQTDFKPMLIDARPLDLSNTPDKAEEYQLPTTQRIIKLTHTGADAETPPRLEKTAYLISEHTPQIHDEKKLRKWKTVAIRYTLYPSLQAVYNHLKTQPEAVRKKINQRVRLLEQLPFRDHFIEKPDCREETKTILQQRDRTHGYTQTDLDIHDKIQTLINKGDTLSLPAQRAIIQAIIDLLKTSQESHLNMIHHLQNHREAIRKLL